MRRPTSSVNYSTPTSTTVGLTNTIDSWRSVIKSDGSVAVETRMIVRDMELATPENLEQDIVNLALAGALHERMQRIGRWVEQGKIFVAADQVQRRYLVRVGTTTFQESKDDFPSLELIAKIALGIAAGVIPAEDSRPYSHLADRQLSYGPVFDHIRELTAPVTKRRKGLRP